MAWGQPNAFNVAAGFYLSGNLVQEFKFLWGDCGGGVINGTYVNDAVGNYCGRPPCISSTVAGLDAATLRPCDLFTEKGSAILAPDALIWEYANLNQAGATDCIAALATAPMTLIVEADEVRFDVNPKVLTVNGAAYNTLPPSAVFIAAAVKSIQW
jgi:hypothetical protein